MIYAVTIVKKGEASGNWFLVHDEIFQENHSDDPFIHTKSSLKLMEKAIKTATDKAKKNGNVVRIWSPGQGIRFLDITSIAGFKIVNLTVSDNATKYLPLA